ncbi:hypothetical protein [uncultured Hyphomicrobium sp.]|jgi:hypothetical protein|uniref:hypothetical protein n=1 Tax=uncultured Hyphomicrobium sp. TaxID=194373 RepID=UPI0025D504FE|nr:hypothetical protein [uncultured Hyphomicrobium sp.]
MSTDADQLDAMIIEGEERIAEYEAQLRDAPPDIDIARATHILLLLYRGLNRLYAERLASLANEYRIAAWREGDTSVWLH